MINYLTTDKLKKRKEIQILLKQDDTYGNESVFLLNSLSFQALQDTDIQ